MRFQFAAALIATAIAARGEARTVVVHVVSPSCSAATLRAAPTGGGVAIEHRWSGGDVSFDLAAGAWTIAAAAPGCWAPPVDAGAETVKVTLWPAATIRFRVEEPRDAAIEVRLASADGKIAPVAIDCARGALRTCSVPATALDLRIGAEGFVPLYVWGKDVAPRARVDLGAVRLTRGASVSGRVALPLRDPKLEGITVQLAPASLAALNGDAGHKALLTQTAATNRRGFFQFAGVPEGMYTLVASAEGWSPASMLDVRVVTGAEVTLPKPVALTPLAKLEVMVDPPSDAGGKPWHIKMVRTWPVTGAPAEAIRATASPAGDWARPQLEAGRYDLSVADAAGSTFHREFVDVSDGMPPLRVSIGSLRVRGLVKFRGEPLECGIWLTHPMNASASIRLRSDKDGKFEAVLPEEGTWRVQLALANNYAQLRPIEIRRRSDGAPVEIELVLPGGRIRGKTVDESGQLVSSFVMILQKGSVAASMNTSDGNFDVIGVESTDLAVHADNKALDRDSGVVPIHVTEGSDDPVTIALPKRRKAKAWLATPDGQPIAGALVRYVSGGSLKEEVTGPGGELTLPLPANELSVPLVILSPGLPRKMMMLAVGGEPAEIVVSPLGARLLLQRTFDKYWIAHDGVMLYGGFVFEPRTGGPPREMTSNGWALDFEPGSYSICATMSRERCKTVALQAGTTTTVDVSEILK